MADEDDEREHVVWVGRVPAGLCAREKSVHELFEECGTLRSVKVPSSAAAIHHNYEDMNSEGFMYLSFATLSAAERAVAAVQTGTLGQENSSGSSFYEAMQARMALRRGGAPVAVVDDDTADLLLGRRQANLSNPFSQRSYGDDEDDLMLQSVAFGGSSQTKKKKKKKGTKITKKAKRPRANSFLSPADE